MMFTLLGLLATASAGDARQPVMDLLNAHDGAAPHEAFAKLGDGVPAELMAIAIDTEVPHSRRARAVSALGHFPTDDCRSFLEARLVDDDSLLQRKAAWALATGWGEASLTQLQPLLTHENVQLRLATVRAIASVGTPAARTALEAHLPSEKNSTVQEALQASLSVEARP